MAELTEKEYDALSECYTKVPPVVNPAKKGTGFFTKKISMARTVTIDALSADYLTAKAIATNKTPADIISELIQREIAAAL